MRVLELAPEVYVSGQMFEHDVRLAAKQGVRSIMNNRPEKDFAAACDELERPLLIFCRSGARSTQIWQLAESQSLL
jgi:protein tyrosine phosphatase (PTP) superfamily phosphohydrolase (DUF442 family)